MWDYFFEITCPKEKYKIIINKFFNIYKRTTECENNVFGGSFHKLKTKN